MLECFPLEKCSNVSKELDEQNCRLRLDKTVLSLRDSPDTLGNGTIYDITVEKTYNSVSKRNDKSSDVVHPSASGFPPMESPSSSSGISVLLWVCSYLVAHSLCFNERTIRTDCIWIITDSRHCREC